jgi:hypothetical protein
MADEVKASTDTAPAKDVATLIYQVMSDSVTALAIGVTREAILKHNQGKFAQLAHYNVESLVTHFLELGMRSTLTAIDADRERRNKEAYVSEMSKLEAPNPEDIDQLVKYAASCKALRAKYGIGGDKQQV